MKFKTYRKRTQIAARVSKLRMQIVPVEVLEVSGQFCDRSKFSHVWLWWLCAIVLFVHPKHNSKYLGAFGIRGIQTVFKVIEASMYLRIARKWAGGHAYCYKTFL